MFDEPERKWKVLLASVSGGLHNRGSCEIAVWQASPSQSPIVSSREWFLSAIVAFKGVESHWASSQAISLRLYIYAKTNRAKVDAQEER